MNSIPRRWARSRRSKSQRNSLWPGHRSKHSFDLHAPTKRRNFPIARMLRRYLLGLTENEAVVWSRGQVLFWFFVDIESATNMSIQNTQRPKPSASNRRHERLLTCCPSPRLAAIEIASATEFSITTTRTALVLRSNQLKRSKMLLDRMPLVGYSNTNSISLTKQRMTSVHFRI